MEDGRRCDSISSGYMNDRPEAGCCLSYPQEVDIRSFRLFYFTCFLVPDCTLKQEDSLYPPFCMKRVPMFNSETQGRSRV